MKKELLVAELNKNNEFNELCTPEKLTKLLDKDVYVINNVFVSGGVSGGQLLTGAELDCPYVTVGKEYTLHNIEQPSEFDRLEIWGEGYDDRYGFKIKASYDSINKCITFSLTECPQDEREPTPRLPRPCYLTLFIAFSSIL